MVLRMMNLELQPCLSHLKPLLLWLLCQLRIPVLAVHLQRKMLPFSEEDVAMFRGWCCQFHCFEEETSSYQAGCATSDITGFCSGTCVSSSSGSTSTCVTESTSDLIYKMAAFSISVNMVASFACFHCFKCKISLKDIHSVRHLNYRPLVMNVTRFSSLNLRALLWPMDARSLCENPFCWHI